MHTKHLVYWKQQLAGAPALLELPTDRPRPAMQTFNGQTVSFDLSLALAARLRALSCQAGASLFMTLYAAFVVWLYRYTGQKDIVIGTPIGAPAAAHNSHETEPPISFFANTLALRTNLTGALTFRDLLAQARQTTLDAYTHQDIPFEQVVDELNLERSLSYSPLFQVMFALHNAPGQKSEWPGLTLTSTEQANRMVKLDLTMAMTETEQGMAGELGYNGDLFEATTITRMVGHFQVLLEGIATDPGRALADLPLLTEAERHQILVEWNVTQSGYPRDKCIHHLFEAQVEQCPESVAVVFEDQHLTYRALNTRANQLAHYLRTLGVASETLVGLCVERSLEMVVSILGILKAGGAYVPLDPAYPRERLAMIVQDAHLPLLLTQHGLATDLGDATAHLLCLDTDWDEIAGQNTANLSLGESDGLAYAIYTSGSTGKPKGVLIPHRALVNFVYAMRQQPGMAARDVLLAVTSLSFDIAGLELYLPLVSGAQVVLASRQAAADGAKLLELLTTCGVTVMQATPTTWRLLLEAGWRDADRFKALCGGEALPADLAHQLLGRDVALWNMYGPTETTIWSTIGRVIARDKSIGIGCPIANTQVYILDENFQLVTIGVPGELYIGGAGLARGYLNRPDLTSERFIPDPFSQDPGSRLYRSGDRVRYRPGGDIEFLGRVDFQVKLRGHRIELGEIEAVLARHPAVRQAVVLLREDQPQRTQLVAYMVRQSAGGIERVTPDILRTYLKQTLPDYMLPAAFVFLEALPLTPNGKIDRRALPAPERTGSGKDSIAPRTPTEDKLATIWAEVLGLEQIGIHDNFLDLGGHSLLATQIVSRIRSSFKVELSVRRLFKSPTISELGAHIERVGQAQQGQLGMTEPSSTPFALRPIGSVHRGGSLPLSFAQQRLWFLDQLEGPSPTYNIPAALRLTGYLDIAAMARSLNEIVRRHEALRTTFVGIAGQPHQVIVPSLILPLPLIDLQALPEADQSAEAKRLITQEAQCPFDLSTAPLLRTTLIKTSIPQLATHHSQPATGNPEHILLLTLHHIVSDDWSMQVLFRELETLYTAFCAGQPSPLPELAIQYADYAAWQREWLSGEVLERQLAYWKRQLAGAPVLLELPTDRPRPPVQTYNGQTLSFELAPALTAQLRALSRQAGVSLFMTLYAAFAAMLYRYTGQADILIGMPIAGRNRQEIEALIGFFVNTLVLRADLSGAPAFRDLLAQARQTALDAYTHQDIPFEQLVDELKPERTLSYSPLFQVMFTLQNASGPGLELPGLSIAPMELESHTSKFDLSLAMAETGQCLVGELEYNRDLFEAATISRMVGHWRTWLEGIVDDPGQRITDLQLLTEVERHQVLVEWNVTQTGYPRDKCIHHLFEAQVEQRPDAIAVIFEDAHLTYHALNARANQLAHYLQTLGVGAEDWVGVCVERSIEMIVGVLAILKAGGVYVPLDPAHPQERLSLIIQDAHLKRLLTQHHLAVSLDCNTTYQIYLDTDWNKIAGQSVADPDGLKESTMLAYAIYTSGSTGKPKGVLVSHRALVNFMHTMQQRPGMTEHDILLAVTTLSFDIAGLELYLPLISGAYFVLASHQAAVDGNELRQLLARSGATVMQATPTTWRLLLEAGWQPARRLKALCGGEALPADLARQLLDRDVVLWNMYGPTETTIWSTVCQISDRDESILIGRPIANTLAYILDKQFQAVPIGAPGELCLGGEGLARGYHNRPDLTAERFIPNPFCSEGELEGGNRIYRTGDLVRYRPSGDIEFLGRLDHQVKLRGFRIELGEIEAALTRQPAVRQAVVLLREDESRRKQLVAYLVCPSTGEAVRITPDVLRAHLRQSLPDYMVPTAFVFLDALPLTPNGKLDRRALPAPGKPDRQEGYVAPRNSTEEVLAAIWAEVLGVEQVGIHDNFFELGGHSLLATQIVSRLRPALQVELPVRCLFDASTIAKLSVVIAGGQAETRWPAPPITPASRIGHRPLSFAQQRLWFLDQLEGAGSTYNLPSALRLVGALDIAALTSALNEIVRRHEALRTTFVGIAGQPHQVIAPSLILPLPLIDLQALPEADQSAEAKRLITQEAQRPFDLSTAPLLRTSLIKTSTPQLAIPHSQPSTLNSQLSASDIQHLLLLAMHHIVSDVWSMQVLFRELEALYTAFCAGRSSPLPELPIQYADYAAWQRGWLSGEVLERQLAYWKRQLAGAPALLELPGDRPRPPVQTYNGQTLSFELAPALTTQLHALSRQAGVSLFMTLYAALAAMLYRYTGQADILIGTPIAGRNRQEIEALIGFFVNTLVLRADLSGAPAFRDLLAQVRQTTLDAYTHQDIPFEQLVDELKPERTLSISPLFQVMFVLQNAPGQELALPGLTVAPVELESHTSKFDLSLAMAETGQGLVGELEYNSDLFEAATISRMVGHWRTWLEGIATDPGRRITDAQLLTEVERRQVLVEWNDTWAAYPRDKCIHHLFEAQVEHSPEAVAVVFEDQHLTYCALNARANQLAHHLQALGIAPETLVGLCVERSLDMIIGLYGILKAGGAYVPLDPAYPPERLAFMLQDAHAAVLLTQSHLVTRLPKQPGEILCLDTDWKSIARASRETPDLVSAGNLAYAIYTSGSTGKPKGVLAPHRGVVNMAEAQARLFSLSLSDRVIQFSSLSFDAALYEIILALRSGASLCLTPAGLLAGSELARWLHENCITVATLPPAALASIPHQLLPNLRLLMVAGEACPPNLAARWNAGRRFYNLYGPTEASIWGTVAEYSADPLRLPIGRPIPNVQAYVLDAHFNPVAIGSPGELCLGGAGITRGYLNRPDLTAERFVPNPFPSCSPGEPEAGGRLYRTGDLVRYLPSGAIEFLGRLDHQVKLRGFRIELGEIEATLAQHPAVHQAVVLLREDQPECKQLVAYIVCRSTDDTVRLSPDSLRAHLKQSLPDYMLPAAFVFLDALPMTPNGKLDRSALPSPDRPDRQESYAAPRNPTEKALAAVWAEVLRLERVGIHDNFFELGGHSLLATQVTSRIRTVFQIEIPLKVIFSSSTIAGMAGWIEAGTKTPTQTARMEPIFKEETL